MTMMASFGGGTLSILYSLSRLKGKLDAMDVINGILGSLVSVTAGCFLYKGMKRIRKSTFLKRYLRLCM